MGTQAMMLGKCVFCAKVDAMSNLPWMKTRYEEVTGYAHNTCMPDSFNDLDNRDKWYLDANMMNDRIWARYLEG